MTFSPAGGHGEVQGQPSYTHAVAVGVEEGRYSDLRSVTEVFVNNFTGRNRGATRRGDYERGRIDGRDALAASFSNTNETTREIEIINIYTALLRDGKFFYMVTVAPQNDYRNFESSFQTMLRSVQFNR